MLAVLEADGTLRALAVEHPRVRCTRASETAHLQAAEAEPAVRALVIAAHCYDGAGWNSHWTLFLAYPVSFKNSMSNLSALSWTLALDKVSIEPGATVFS